MKARDLERLKGYMKMQIEVLELIYELIAHDRKSGLDTIGEMEILEQHFISQRLSCIGVQKLIDRHIEHFELVDKRLQAVKPIDTKVLNPNVKPSTTGSNTKMNARDQISLFA